MATVYLCDDLKHDRKVALKLLKPELAAVLTQRGRAESGRHRQLQLHGSHPNWDVSPDGSEFLMLRRSDEEVQVILVQNWGREVAALSAAKSAK